MLCGALFSSRVNAVVVLCAAAGVAKGGVHAEGCVGARTGRSLLRATSRGRSVSRRRNIRNKTAVAYSRTQLPSALQHASEPRLGKGKACTRAAAEQLQILVINTRDHRERVQQL